MSATIFEGYFLARRVAAFLHYLHLDVAITGALLIVLLLAGWVNAPTAIHSTVAARPSLSAATDVPTPSTEDERTGETLTPAMRAALNDVVQRYRVSAAALMPVFEAAQSAARERHLDPLLLIAVISIESRFNPFSQSPMGAQGLMQIIPRFHLEKVANTDSDQPFLDPIVNVQVGARILQEAIRRHGGLVAGLQYYAGAADDDDQTYANKVLAEKLRLEQASRRRAGASA